MRTDKKSGHDIAQHKRLLELFEHYCDNARNDKYQRKVFYKIRKFTHFISVIRLYGYKVVRYL